MTNNNYGEIICEAVDTLVQKRLSEISFDTTILCSIVDDSERDKGKYIVSNGSAKFEAYSNDTSLRNRNNVYVQIPNGDWNQQKIIIGKKIDGEEAPINYISPMSQLVDITGNLLFNEHSYGLIANNPNETVIDNIEVYNMHTTSIEEFKNGLPQYTRLGLSAQFRTWLAQFNTVEGSYGLRLILEAEGQKTITQEEENQEEPANEQQIQYIIELDSSNMYGNPYNFESYFQQERVFDISILEKIIKINLQFYQKYESFKDNEGNIISHQDYFRKLLNPNIFVKDIYISLGYDVNEFEDEMIKIFSLNSPTYTASSVIEKQKNYKKLQLRWIHKLTDDSFKSIDPTEENLNFEIRWYRYELGAGAADQYSGVYWLPLAKYNSTIKDSYEILDKDWLNDQIAINTNFEAWLIPKTNRQEERIKAILLFNNKVYYSNILTFTNEKEVVGSAVINALKALNIICKDETFGNYRIYNYGNNLIDSAQGKIEREFILHFNVEEDKENKESSVLTEAEKIEWIIPNLRTMISVIIPEGLKELSGPEEENVALEDYYWVDEDYIHIIRYGNSEDNYSLGDKNVLKYKIKSYFTQNNNNNTISCIVTKNGDTYTVSKELTFGLAGTTGTDYTLLLDFEGLDVLTVGNNQPVTVVAKLYDYENKEIDWSEFGSKISWSWKDAEDGSDSVQDGMTIDAKDNKASILLNNKYKIDGTNYNIIQCTITKTTTDEKTFDLTAYLPIPVRSSTEYSFISGSSMLIYDTAGLIMDYFQSPLKVYTNQGEAIEYKDSNGNIYNWDINSGEVNSVYKPVIESIKLDNEIVGQRLRPLTTFIKDTNKQLCLYLTKNNSEIIWSQPLLYIQNKYPSAMLNNWDGSLDIGGKDGNSIFAPKIVAGKKEEGNTFSGVIMGDFGKTDSEGNITANTGIYGFVKGEQSFAFKDNGTAFIGVANSGQIEFNGTDGTISSSGYRSGSGMELKLAGKTSDGENGESYLEIIKKKENSNGSATIVKISSESPYLKIGTLSEKTLINIGNEDYYLQSANYSAENKTGTRLDLDDGNINIGSGTFSNSININGSNIIYNKYKYTGDLTAGEDGIYGTFTYEPISLLNPAITGITTISLNTIISDLYSKASYLDAVQSQANYAISKLQGDVNYLKQICTFDKEDATKITGYKMPINLYYTTKTGEDETVTQTGKIEGCSDGVGGDYQSILIQADNSINLYGKTGVLAYADTITSKRQLIGGFGSYDTSGNCFPFLLLGNLGYGDELPAINNYGVVADADGLIFFKI